MKKNYFLLLASLFVWQINAQMMNPNAAQMSSTEPLPLETFAAPSCPINPYPEDGSTTVSAFDPLYLTWEAPVTGNPTSYDLYFGYTPDELELAAELTTTGFDLGGAIEAYNFTGYWKVIAKNADGESVGCAVWTFTTEPPPAAPANDDCIGATSLTVDDSFCDGTATNGNNDGATDSGVAPATCFYSGENDVWYSFVTPNDVATVDISTDFLGGTLDNTEIALYSGACGSLTELACDTDSGVVVQTVNGYTWNSLITDTAVTAGATYYVRVSGYTGADVGTFCIKVSTNQLLSNEGFDTSHFAYYPNPVKNVLNLSYHKMITNVELFNVLGQKMSTESIGAHVGQVDVSSLASGTYLVKVTDSDNHTETIKVIKE